MKDTHQANERVMLSNSSQALKACISPTSSPAESTWFNRLVGRSCQGSPHRDQMTLSNWDAGPGKDAAVIRIGDAVPCGTQHATEPEGSSKLRVHPDEDSSTLSEKTLVFSGSVKLEHDPSRPADEANLPQGLDLSMRDSRSDDQLLRVKHSERKFWRSNISETVKLGKGGPFLPFSPSQDQCNEDQPLLAAEGTLDSFQRSHGTNHNHILPRPSSSVALTPWKVEGDDMAQSQKKPSHLSEIERQRGPIKKRHYQPEVLDLSTKRPKAETESITKTLPNEEVTSAQELFQEQLRLSPKREPTQNFSSCFNEHPQPSERLLQAQESFQEKLSKALKQEQAHSVNDVTRQRRISQSEPSRGLLSLSGDSEFVEVPNFDRKQGAYAALRCSGLGEQTGTNVNNNYSSGNFLLTVLPSADFGRPWVLQMTQREEMLALQQLQAKLAPDLSKTKHSSKSGVSHQADMTSLPLSKIPRKSLMYVSESAKTEKPYACEHCSSRFKHRHHVIRHMRAHNGERPFHCEHCGATFARKCVLTNHRRTHTGEKPYICSECGDTFSRKHHLVIHQRTHSGEKPYQCLDCGAAFARSHHVNRHRKTHEKEQEIDAHIERLQASSAAEISIPILPATPRTSPNNKTPSSPEPQPTGSTDNKLCLPVQNAAALIPSSNSSHHTD